MNKKEIAEVRKTFKVDKCCIDRVCACYVTPDKQKTVIPVESFNSLDEESMEKYLEIFKKSVSGSLGKQLQSIEFPTEAEQKGRGQDLLYNLQATELKDEDQVGILFDKVIENYVTDSYYCILIMHANYDIVSKASDDTDLDSDTVYSHIICSICPTNLSKPFLSYNQDENKLEDSMRSWLIEMPQCAFLFPTLTDRTPDIHSVLVYNKKTSELNEGIIERVLDCLVPTSAEEQSSAFIESTLAGFDGRITYDKVSAIHDALCEQIEESVDGATIMMSKDSIKQVLQDEDAPNLDAFDKKYNELIGEKEVFLENIVDKNKFVIKMDGITITANTITKGLISVKEVNGQKCLVIAPNGEMEVDGIGTQLF